MAIKLEAAPRYQFVGSITYKNKLERTLGVTASLLVTCPARSSIAALIVTARGDFHARSYAYGRELSSSSQQ
jgi:hypothetical protein